MGGERKCGRLAALQGGLGGGKESPPSSSSTPLSRIVENETIYRQAARRDNTLEACEAPDHECFYNKSVSISRIELATYIEVKRKTTDTGGISKLTYRPEP